MVCVVGGHIKTHDRSTFDWTHRSIPLILLYLEYLWNIKRCYQLILLHSDTGSNSFKNNEKSNNFCLSDCCIQIDRVRYNALKRKNALRRRANGFQSDRITMLFNLNWTQAKLYSVPVTDWIVCVETDKMCEREEKRSSQRKQNKIFFRIHVSVCVLRVCRMCVCCECFVWYMTHTHTWKQQRSTVHAWHVYKCSRS